MPKLKEILFKTAAEKEYEQKVHDLGQARVKSLSWSEFGYQITFPSYFTNQVKDLSFFKRYTTLQRLFRWIWMYALVTVICFFITHDARASTILAAQTFVLFILISLPFSKNNTKEAFIRRNELVPEVLQTLNKEKEYGEQRLSELNAMWNKYQEPAIEDIKAIIEPRHVALFDDAKCKEYWDIEKKDFLMKLYGRKLDRERLLQCLNNEIAFVTTLK